MTPFLLVYSDTGGLFKRNLCGLCHMQMAQPQFTKWKHVHPVTGDPGALPDAGDAAAERR